MNITTLHINAPVVFIPGEDFCKTLQMTLENKNKETETYINPEKHMQNSKHSSIRLKEQIIF